MTNIYRLDPAGSKLQVGYIEYYKIYRAPTSWGGDNIGSVEGNKVYRPDPCLNPS